MALLKFIYGRLRARDRATIKDTAWLAFWTAFAVLVFRTHEPTIPPFEQLQVAEGPLRFKQVNNRWMRGTFIVVDGREYGCGMLWFGPSQCHFDTAQQRALAGKPAKVWWYEQRTHLWYGYPVAAQIEVAGAIVKPGLYFKTYQNTVKLEWDEYRFSFFFNLIGMVFLLSVFVGRYVWQQTKRYRQFTTLATGGMDHVEHGDQRS